MLDVHCDDVKVFAGLYDEGLATPTATARLGPILFLGLWNPRTLQPKLRKSNSSGKSRPTGQGKLSMSYFDGHIRDLGPLPQAAIAPFEKLSTCQNLWATESTKFSTMFPSTPHIIFKFPDNYPLSHVPASYRPAWIEWKHLLIPITSGVIEKRGLGECETSKVMLARVNRGGTISEHIDENPSSAVPHKIHVPLLTHRKAIFHCEGVTYDL